MTALRRKNSQWKMYTIYRFRKGLGFAQPFHASIYSTRSGLVSRHEALRSKTTSLSVYLQQTGHYITIVANLERDTEIPKTNNS